MSNETFFSAGQEAMLARVGDEWDALSAAPVNRVAAEAGIRAAYRAAGLAAPAVIIWLDSPYAGAVSASILHSVSRVFGGTGHSCGDRVSYDLMAQAFSVIEEQVGSAARETVQAQFSDRLGGDSELQAVIHSVVETQTAAAPCHRIMGEVKAGLAAAGWRWESIDAEFRDRGLSQDSLGQGYSSWNLGIVHGHHPSCALVDAFSRIGVTGLAPALEGPVAAARSAGSWWPWAKAVLVTGRPGRLARDGEGRLHCRGGLAVSYRDGWGFHAWHGRPVPAWVAEAPTMDRIAAEPNIMYRRCAIESLGWDQFIAEARLVPVTTAPGQALYDMPEQLWGDRVRMLMRSDGTRATGALIVPRWVRDPAEAAEWDAGLHEAGRVQWLKRYGTPHDLPGHRRASDRQKEKRT
jgi:hypothetical protein